MASTKTRTREATGAAAESLLGRENEVSELSRLLERERFVTLTGAPGIGKSRLALDLAEHFSDGAHWVGLATVARPAHVPRALASTLSVDEQAGQSLTETLLARLSARRMLLVLDNCEHLLTACAKLVAALLSGCPQVRVLSTSREPLGLGPELVWEVPPLSVPEPGEEALPEALGAYPAVQLFVERAAAVQPGFSLNPYVAPAVAEICRRLDGIPLAIELAAARVESLTPEEIAGRLDDRFGLLIKAGGGGPSHHETLQAALDWSHDQLCERERALLRRLSVFVGSFELGAAEALFACGKHGTGSNGGAGRQVSDLLARLVRKSLVVAEGASSPPPRYRLLETIRAYAGDRLEEAGEAAELRAAHARFYLALAEHAEPELSGPDQDRWLARLEAEHANLRSAIGWSLSHGREEWALRVAGALVLFWRVRCHFGEGRELLDAVLAAGERAPSGLRAKALWGVGFMALMMGEFDAGLAPLEESLSRFRKLGDHRGCARTLLILGNCVQFRDRERGLSLLGESAAMARDAGDCWGLAHALGVAGNVRLARAELAAARSLFEEAVAVARNAEDKQGVRFGLLGLAKVVLRQGDLALAESLLGEALEIADELDETYGIAAATQGLGQLALLRGDYRRAWKLFQEAAELYREVGHVAGLVDALLGLAEVAHSEGKREAARRLYEEALATARAHGGILIAATRGLGRLAAEEPRLHDARVLLQEARQQARSRGNRWETAHVLYDLAEVARSERELKRAAVLHDEALELIRAIGSTPKIVASLEAVGGVAAEDGRCGHAARLFGAAKALRERHGYARAPWEAQRYEADLALICRELGARDAGALLAEGEMLAYEEAAAQASVGRGAEGRPLVGWQSLTQREREVAALVADGLTNRDIAERLFITPATVKRHLRHIFRKLGIADRADLVRESRLA